MIDVDKVYNAAKALCYGIAGRAAGITNGADITDRERKIIDAISEFMGSRDCEIAKLKLTIPDGAETEPRPNRCEGRYPVPMRRDEPFDVTYRCGLAHGHLGPCGAEIGHNLSSPEAQIGHALSAAVVDWKQAALILGEQLATCGPAGYYNFTPDQWLAWARSQIGRAPEPASAEKPPPSERT